MRLVLFHPGAARIDCDDCKQFVFDLDTGEKETYRSGPTRELLPMARSPETPTPCQKCPKGSPEKAKEVELSAKNWAAFAHYLQAKSVGLSEMERDDPIVRRNFAIVDGIVKEHERREQGHHLAEALIAVLTKK